MRSSAAHSLDSKRRPNPPISAHMRYLRGFTRERILPDMRYLAGGEARLAVQHHSVGSAHRKGDWKSDINTEDRQKWTYRHCGFSRLGPILLSVGRASQQIQLVHSHSLSSQRSQRPAVIAAYISRSSGGSSTSTRRPHLNISQHISTRLEARNRTILLPSGCSSIVWLVWMR